MIVGYVRVSSASQKKDRQIKLLTETYKAEKIFQETMTGKTAKRPQLQAMIDFVRSGDTLVVESYSRLARSTKDLLTIVETLAQKDVILISDKEKIDSSTSTGKLFMTIVAGIAQFERECLLDRQAEGIKVAKEQGKYKGRKKDKFDKVKFAEVYERWRVKEEIKAVEAMQILGLKCNTFYRRVNEYEKMIGVKNENDE